MKRKDLLLVFLIAFLMRIPSLFVPYYSIDELTNGIFANFILNGELGLKDYMGHPSLLVIYSYVAIFKIFGAYNLIAVHAIYAIYVGLTAVALYLDGRELTGKREGGLAAGFLYGLFSIAFVSKEFYSPQPEGLAVLPLALASLFIFKFSRSQKLFFLALAGFGIGLATLFKATAGIAIVALGIAIVFKGTRKIVAIAVSGFGLLLALSLPFIAYGDFLQALSLTLNRIFIVKEGYIKSYAQLPQFYAISKYMIRTTLVMLAALPLWILAIKSCRDIFRRPIFEKWFLVSHLVLALAVVLLGNRVFFHYYLTLLSPLSLLAADQVARHFSLDAWRGFKAYWALRSRVFRMVAILGLLSVVGFGLDGLFGFSLPRRHVSKAVEEIQALSTPSDRIYVWGLFPQLYFESRRQPASTMIWADFLAGFTPGSPAMEYARATGKKLPFWEGIVRDLKPSHEEERLTPPLSKSPFYRIKETELLLDKEIIESQSDPRWKQVLADFYAHPPKLFLDTSPTGIRGFSKYPIEKYELLRHFIEEHYEYVGTVDKIVFYRLKKV